jgi:hypothetical protein
MDIEHDTVNLWNKPDVPHKGWACHDVTDNETADATCEMCGNERIRYVHAMVHIEYTGQLSVGCVCAEKMSGDYVNPKRRERKLKNAAAKKAKDHKRQLSEENERRDCLTNATWHESKNGNPYFKARLEYKHGVRICHVVIVKSKFGAFWAFGVDGEFSSYKYANVEDAKTAARTAALRKFGF